MNDEDVIKRILLINGSSQADDLRLNFLMKLMFRWVKVENTGTEEMIYDNVLSHMSTIESEMRKAVLTYKVACQDHLDFTSIIDQFKIEVEKIRRIIRDCQKDISHFHKERKKMKKIVDPLIFKLNEFPLLNVIIEKMYDLQKTIIDLHETYEQLSNKNKMLSNYVFQLKLAIDNLKVSNK